MNRQSVTDSGVFSDSEMIQAIGIRAKIRTNAIAMLQKAYSRVPRRMAYVPGLPSAMRTPSTRTNANAMIKTEMKINTETAEPSPRLVREISWLYPRIDTDSVF